MGIFECTATSYCYCCTLYMHLATYLAAGCWKAVICRGVSLWLAKKNSCLHLNVGKTVCMFFSKSASKEPDPTVMVDRKALKVVQGTSIIRSISTSCFGYGQYSSLADSDGCTYGLSNVFMLYCFIPVCLHLFQDHLFCLWTVLTYSMHLQLWWAQLQHLLCISRIPLKY